MEAVRALELATADYDLIRGKREERVGDRLHGVGVAEDPARVQPVFAQAAHGRVEANLRGGTVDRIVGEPTV